MGMVLKADDLGSPTDAAYLNPYDDEVYLSDVTREWYDAQPGATSRVVHEHERGPIGSSRSQLLVVAYEKRVGALRIWCPFAPRHAGGIENPLARPPTPGGEA